MALICFPLNIERESEVGEMIVMMEVILDKDFILEHPSQVKIKAAKGSHTLCERNSSALMNLLILVAPWKPFLDRVSGWDQERCISGESSASFNSNLFRDEHTQQRYEMMQTLNFNSKR
ncbi:unnamed protein product [Sphenostylis stenocarpa]|uniref:Uncharacterized protein n=1 Tax=Sphenostylis stenocarpa TaxID=92480 RepID=A0AA86T4K1_9FABA|nr:unnamed protein product [Sphenostylis stenocarpa]